jgi:hypothetical protein
MVRAASSRSRAVRSVASASGRHAPKGGIHQGQREQPAAPRYMGERQS